MNDVVTNNSSKQEKEKANSKLERLDVNQVMRLIPHRYPFLLIDGMEDIDVEVGAVGVKNVTINDHYFQGHFPGHPVMPGVLIIEAMAQTAAAFVVHKLGDGALNKLVYFMTIDKARFRAPVVPGDRLKLDVRVTKSRGTIWKFRGEARVDGKTVADAEFGAMIRDR